jgi:D-alanyl-D-alanine carboxypeptidase
MASLRGLVPGLYPWAAALLARAAAAGGSYRVDSVRRSHRLQARLYRTYLNLRRRGWSDAEIGSRYGLFHPARPGTSAHEVGRAFDVRFFGVSQEAMGGLWQSWGGRWGGATDPVHFEA